ncbi:hypothetical protein RSOLAG1IB_06182 [Rhizoctonia solani AG-1 IB]|uniref:T6SS Phospholipase effector Tle1-like catalytic domain-containing protein n=1 Tax=Thanatephorus cucumeris (strain AG1-IB / isolate 7/3/14) TaxID=1108050 RepID=A0A0B7F574_THACB|nr:hypothetical protein RSOLAG1IB_06182 [Rhizoctonia solani AG-1 IB]
MADKNEPRSAAPISFETEKYLIGAMSLEQNDNQERHSVDMSARPENVDPKCFKMVFCTPIEIKFLGVWDTVGSVGAFKRKTLPHIEYNASVKHFRQALALDETRGNFIPSVWDHSKTQLEQGGQSAVEVWFKGGHSDVGGGAPLHSSDRKSPLFERLRPSYDRFSELSLSIAKKIRCLRRPADSRQLEPETFAGDLDPPSPTSPVVTDPLSLMPPPPLNLDSDDPPKRLPDLSNISFRWMINQCLSLPDVRVLFDPYAMHCYRRAKIIEERPSGERSMERTQENRIKLDSFDITPKPYRVITKALWWWILEIAFIPKLAQRGSNRSRPETVYCPNLGTARLVNSSHDKDQIRLHYSAYGEINKGSGYQPIAEWYSEDKKVHIEDAPTSSAESKSQSIFDIVEMGWKPSLYQTHIRELTKSFLGRIVLHASVAGLLWLFVASTKVSILSIRHLLSGPASPKALLQRVITFRNWAFHYFRGQNYYVGLTTHNGP